MGSRPFFIKNKHVCVLSLANHTHAASKMDTILGQVWAVKFVGEKGNMVIDLLSSCSYVGG